MPVDFRDAADRHFTDAGLLSQARRLANADHLYGVAAECGYLNLVHPKAILQWAERLARLVEELEGREKPDVVFLDSRAGLHDIAAVTVTRLEAAAFLFAINSPQTWRSYELLFKHWQSHPQLGEFRDRLQMVAA